jgi:plasmid stabilization system protein ParE
VAHRLIFDPEIPDDLATALDHYERVSPELANRFRQNVNRRLDDVAERPESYAFDVDPIRFAKVDRFPYLVFFVVNPNFVSILAVVHGSSEPDKWRCRHQT